MEPSTRSSQVGATINTLGSDPFDGVFRAGRLVVVQARKGVEQLPGFGFKLAYEGQIAFSVTVCHVRQLHAALGELAS
jgi:hypothetical protein